MSNKYKELIKKFEEGINQRHIIKVKNVKVRKEFVMADIHLIDIYEGHTSIKIYKECKYIRSELDSDWIRHRRYKNRHDEF